jgi:ribonuclease VapC
MVIDTSALVAILDNDADARRYADAIAAAPVRLVSAATLLEASIVLVARHGEEALADLDQLLRDAEAEVVPVTEEHARLARQGFLQFGKGRHPARLNYGDCFAYALAKASSEPLLFKGNDFVHTDVEPASLQPV